MTSACAIEGSSSIEHARSLCGGGGVCFVVPYVAVSPVQLPPRPHLSEPVIFIEIIIVIFIKIIIAITIKSITSTSTNGQHWKLLHSSQLNSCCIFLIDASTHHGNVWPEHLLLFIDACMHSLQPVAPSGVSYNCTYIILRHIILYTIYYINHISYYWLYHIIHCSLPCQVGFLTIVLPTSWQSEGRHIWDWRVTKFLDCSLKVQSLLEKQLKVMYFNACILKT